MHEVQEHENSVFLTLTYNDENLPKDLSLDKIALRLYFKRLRRLVEPVKIKYYACGEYGEQFGRPHYHAIIFGVRPRDEKLKKAWKFGFVKSGSVTYESARYVAGYIQKKYNNKLAKEVYGDKEPPFQLQSNGIGKEHALRNAENYVNDLSLTVNGIKHSLPRYYRKVYGKAITEEQLLMNRLLKENEIEIALEERKKEQGGKLLSEQAEAQLAQKRAELEFRCSQWKRKF